MSPDSGIITSLCLLHLEDNLRDAALIHAQIQDEWPRCEITRVDTRADFLTALEAGRFDLILSDFSLPAFNGLDALKLSRQRHATVPFMFLSGTIGEENAVQALQLGAVDYVIKDRPARLIPALRRALQQRREQLRREEAEQRLLEQAGLLEKARDAICVADLEGRITYRNAAATRLFGWTVQDGPTRSLMELFGFAGAESFSDALRVVHTTGVWSGDIRCAGQGDAFLHIESRWTLVHDDSGQPKSILSINTDITEQKKLESQLLRSQRVEGIGTLAGGIAHDLNNVLAPILMAVNLLQMRLQDSPHLRLIGVLEKSAEHGAALVRQILAFARGTEGEKTMIQLQLILKDVVTLLGDTLPRSISIETDLPKDLWPVQANSTQLGQVFMNLGINARDAMPGGGRLIFKAENITMDEALARANPGTRPGPYVLITVIDTGTGIPPELLDRIFDPFFTTKAAGKGTGLGLSTVIGIIKGHAGLLQVHSITGQGTRFSLYFPALPTPLTAETPALPARPPSGNGKTILLIDDDEGVRIVGQTILTAFDYKVLAAASGSDGLALYQEHRNEIDAVLADMMMPGLQGHELIAKLQTLDPDVRIVAMSGIKAELDSLTASPGRLALLPKPMAGFDIIHAVQSVIPAASPPHGDG